MFNLSAKSAFGPLLFSLKRALSYQTPQMTLARLLAAPKKKQLIKYDGETGDLFLHAAAKGRMSPARLDQTISILGEKDAAALAKINNNNGNLPLFNASTYQTIDDQMKVRSQLEKLTKTHHQKPLFEPINPDEVMSRYHGLALPQRKVDELKMGCEVVNRIRSLKIDSATHSSINDASLEAFRSTGARISKIRDIASERSQFIARHYPRDDFMKLQTALLHEEVMPLLTFRAGNCHEYAMLALFILIHEHHKKCAELVKMSNDNHVFTMMGRAEGQEGVVVDAHQGDVYLERDIPKYLMDSDNVKMELPHAHGRIWRIMTSYNERYHSTETIFSLTYNNFHFDKARAPKL